jgi:hypothetical protein
MALTTRTNRDRQTNFTSSGHEGASQGVQAAMSAVCPARLHLTASLKLMIAVGSRRNLEASSYSDSATFQLGRDPFWE